MAQTSVEDRSGPALVPSSLIISFDRASLARHLAESGLSFDPDQPIRQFAGGLANRNYLIEIDGKPAVLRRPPEGPLPPGAHDMAREHRITSRLSQVLPFVPRGLHFCADPSVIGAPFQIIEYRAGIVIRGADMSRLADRADAPAILSRRMVEVMAALHSVDANAVGLGELGRPEGFVARNVVNWLERGKRVAEGKVTDVIEQTGTWLRGQDFRAREPALLHCDLKLDNLILDPDTLEVRAVVDWDMGTRGDPLFDLATLLSYWAEAGDPPCMLALDQMPTAAPGFWTRAQAARHYAELTSRPIGDLAPMRILCTLKLGIVFLQLHRQWVTGAVHDPRYEKFKDVGEALLVYARDLTQGAA